MIPADLLDQLREKDPELWKRYAETDLSREEERIDEPWRTAEANEAWLQYCLQEAIRARGWLLEQSTFTASPSAKIWKKTDPVWKTYSAAGSTDAEALLRAYLAAIKGEK